MMAVRSKLTGEGDSSTPSPSGYDVAVMESLEPRLLLSGSIEGHVYDYQTEQPLAGIDVHVFEGSDPASAGWEAGDYVAGATTDSSGYYYIDALPEHFYRVHVEDGQAAGGNYYIGGDIYDVEVIDQALVGGTGDDYEDTSGGFTDTSGGFIDPTWDGSLGATGADFSLRHAGSLAGYVNDEQGNPLGNIEVLCNVEYADGQTDWHSTFSDSTGRYELFLLETSLDVYSLRAFPSSGGASYGGEIAPGFYSAESVGLTGPDFQLAPGGYVHGFVETAAGDPVTTTWSIFDPFVPIEHGIMNDPGAWLDASGEFSIPIPAGRDVYLLSDTTPWITNPSGTVHYSWGERFLGPFNVSAGQTVEAGTFTMPAAAIFTGTVTDDAGNPVAGAEISLQGYDTVGGRVDFETIAATDAAGGYVADWAPAGNYRITAEADGYLLDYDWGELSPGDSLIFDFVLEPESLGADISGHISNFAQAAPQNASSDVLPYDLVDYEDLYGASELGVMAYDASIPWEFAMTLFGGPLTVADAEVEDGFSDYFGASIAQPGTFGMTVPIGGNDLFAYRSGTTQTGGWAANLSDQMSLDSLSSGQQLTGVSLEVPLGDARVYGTVSEPTGVGIFGPGKAQLIQVVEWDGSTAGNIRAVAEPGPGGEYVAPDLPAGTYVIHAYSAAYPPVVSQPFTLSPGESMQKGVTFSSEPQTGDIGGFPFYDANGNGVMDTDESYMLNEVFYLDMDADGQLDAGEPTAVSQDPGKFEFLDLEPGTYRVMMDHNSGFPYQTVPRDPLYYEVTVEAGDSITGLEFGVTMMTTIVGRVFHDVGGDGSWAYDSYLDGRVIFLDDGDGVLEWTDGNANGVWDEGEGERWTESYTRPAVYHLPERPGYYRLELPYGQHNVTQVLPSGWASSLPPSGTHDISLAPPGGTTSHYFGSYPAVTINGRAWNDLDADGAVDEGEAALADRRIFLDDGDGALEWTDGDGDGLWDVGEGERWTRTDASGNYTFSDLVGGAFHVVQELPSGWEQTWPLNDDWYFSQSGPSTRNSVNFGSRQSAEVAVHDDKGSADDQVMGFAAVSLTGSPATGQFTIENIGGVSWTASGWSLTGDVGDFNIQVLDAAGQVVSSGSLTIAPGETYTVDVAFAPTQIGPRSATVSFAGTDASVELTGEGVGEGIDVTLPTSATDWYLGESDTQVQWTGAQGGQVRVTLFHDGQGVGTYLDWTSNDGSETRYAPLSRSWGMGTYRVRVEDSLGNWGYSEPFEISSPLETQTVVLAWGEASPFRIARHETPFGRLVYMPVSGTTPAANVSSSMRQQLLNSVRDVYRRAGVDNLVITDTPTPGASTVYFAELPSPHVDQWSLLGMPASGIDRFNRDRTDESVVYLTGEPRVDAEVIAHEIGHLLGLRHVDPAGDNPLDRSVMDQHLTLPDSPQFVSGVSGLSEPASTGDHCPIYYLERYVDGVEPDALDAWGLGGGSWDDEGDDQTSVSFSFGETNGTLYNVKLFAGFGLPHTMQEIYGASELTFTELAEMDFGVPLDSTVLLVASSTPGGPRDVALTDGDPYVPTNQLFIARASGSDTAQLLKHSEFVPGYESLADVAVRYATPIGESILTVRSPEPGDILLLAADEETFSTDANESVQVDLTGGESTDQLRFDVIRAPSHGELAEGATGVFTYTPAGDYAGADSFAYTVTDTSQPGPPIVSDQFVVDLQVGRLVELSGKVKYSYTDADGDEVKLKFKGDGALELLFAGDDDGDLLGVNITGGGEKDKLKIKARGQTTLGDVDVDGSLKQLKGKGVRLDGDLAVSGTLGKLQIDEMIGGTVALFGQSNNAKLKFDRLVDANIFSIGGLKNIKAKRWEDTDGVLDRVAARVLGKVKIKGAETLPDLSEEPGDALADLMRSVLARNDV